MSIVDATFSVQEYNARENCGKTHQTSADIKTSAGCRPDAMPAFVKPQLARIQDEVVSRYYDCCVCSRLAVRCIPPMATATADCRMPFGVTPCSTTLVGAVPS